MHDSQKWTLDTKKQKVGIERWEYILLCAPQFQLRCCSSAAVTRCICYSAFHSILHDTDNADMVVRAFCRFFYKIGVGSGEDILAKFTYNTMYVDRFNCRSKLRS